MKKYLLKLFIVAIFLTGCERQDIVSNIDECQPKIDSLISIIKKEQARNMNCMHELQSLKNQLETLKEKGE